jgi:trehalose 6-phosphate synthase
MKEPGKRLFIISNCLPVVIEHDGETWQIRAGSGGLVTAIAPVLRDRGGVWIGWPGIQEEVAERARSIRADLQNRCLILGVDRLDYTKGIPQRLEAFRNALMRFPDLRKKVTFIQVVVPSREDLPQYHALKIKIERLISEINGQFTESDWVPIHYIFRSLERTELLSYYRAAEIALITPLKDGMNLVAKEYCASSIGGDGVLILSEFAGGAAQLQNGALLVNPHDIEGVADAIYQAFTMSKEERRTRMRKLRRSIREHDIFWWVDSFLYAGIAQDLDAFPPLEDYVPQPVTSG